MNKNLINDFCLGFYGYGNLKADYWFVGMEEGGENSILSFYRNYVLQWNNNERKPSMDILTGINPDIQLKYFGKDAVIQKTWGRLIRIILSIDNESALDREIVRNYQKDYLGRSNGNNVLLELLPLPNKSVSNWIFESLKIPQLKSRESYLDFYLPKRIQRIKQMIIQQKPKAVIFYSLTRQYVDAWNEIIGTNCKITDGYFVERINGVVFSICKHPNAHGVTNNYYHQIGKEIRTILGGKK